MNVKTLIVGLGITLTVGSASAGVAVMDSGSLAGLFTVINGTDGQVLVAKNNVRCTLGNGANFDSRGDVSFPAGAWIKCVPIVAQTDKGD
ncbi:hypothetical protein ACTU44_21725 (plasmid) [Thalassospira sp. SM2505]